MSFALAASWAAILYGILTLFATGAVVAQEGGGEYVHVEHDLARGLP